MDHKNDSTLLFLLRKDLRAIAVSYDEIDIDKDTTKMVYNPPYLSRGRLPKNARIHKTFDETIQVDDMVVVPTNTRHNLTCCKVIDVDVEIDWNSEKEVPWIVDKVDAEAFEHNRQIEDEVIGRARLAEVGKRREELEANLKKSLGASAVKQLTAASKPRRK